MKPRSKAAQSGLCNAFYPSNAAQNTPAQREHEPGPSIPQRQRG